MKLMKMLAFAVLGFISFAPLAEGHVNLLNPLGGETFDEGDTVDIQWEIAIDHGPCNWDLYFSSDGGTNWNVIQLNMPKSQLNYPWTVPGVATTQGRIKIYMDNDSGPDYQDFSGDFTINLAPTFDVEVEIDDFFFDPAIIQIDVGQTVRWTNISPSINHTTTSVGAVWDSDTLGPGEFFDFTFDTEGVYDYLCFIHPLIMKGTVIVGQPDSIVLDIQIVNFEFIPSDTTVQVGQLVRWINFGSVIHTTTSDSGFWDSGDLEPGDFFILLADSVGDFGYHCTPHPFMMATLHVEDTLAAGCDYVAGDINGDGSALGSDVTYGVRYFKGLGSPPPDSCWNDSSSSWLYSAGDANGSCIFNGADITFVVAFFKGQQPEIMHCPQTPPGGRLTNETSAVIKRR